MVSCTARRGPFRVIETEPPPPKVGPALERVLVSAPTDPHATFEQEDETRIIRPPRERPVAEVRSYVIYSKKVCRRQVHQARPLKTVKFLMAQ